MNMKKIVRITTVPLSLNVFCKGLLAELSADYEVVAVSSPGKELQEIARREGVRTVAVPMERRIAPFKDLVSLWRLVRVFRHECPDMVHSMTPKAGLLGMVAAWMARVPLRVHTFTGLVFPTAAGLRRQVLMCADKLTCRFATHVVAEGQGVKNDLRRFGIAKRPVQVLGHGNVRGIDLKFYDRTADVQAAASGIRLQKGIPADAFVFLFVGRLVTDKGLKELAMAFAQLISVHSSCHLLLVGDEEKDAPLDHDTLRLLASLPTVHSVGWRDDVRPWYAAADALVFPSYREGFPNVVIEACAMGLPCIVTDINGSREIITEGENGVIVPPYDTRSLRDAMQDFVGHRDVTAAMASRARKSVASRFEQGYVRQCLKEYYRSILA